MQQDTNQGDIFSELSFDGIARQYLRSIAGWAMTIVILTVAGYLISVLTLLAGPVKTSGPGNLDAELGFTGSGTVYSVGSIIVGLVINFFLYRFARLVRTGFEGLSQEQVNNSFSNLKIYFTLKSIIGIIVCIIAVVVIIVLGTTISR